MESKGSSGLVCWCMIPKGYKSLLMIGASYIFLVWKLKYFWPFAIFGVMRLLFCGNNIRPFAWKQERLFVLSAKDVPLRPSSSGKTSEQTPAMHYSIKA
jgi:hypothetical protein